MLACSIGQGIVIQDILPVVDDQSVSRYVLCLDPLGSADMEPMVQAPLL